MEEEGWEERRRGRRKRRRGEEGWGGRVKMNGEGGEGWERGDKGRTPQHTQLVLHTGCNLHAFSTVQGP